MKHEFNQVLQVGAEEEKQEEKKQEKLKRKFGIQGKNVIKFTVRVIAAIIRLAATILLIGLAFIGILALIYEEPRKELMDILWNAIDQIKQSVPFFHNLAGEMI